MISVCPSFDVISVLRSDHGDSVEVEKTASGFAVIQPDAFSQQLNPHNSAMPFSVIGAGPEMVRPFRSTNGDRLPPLTRFEWKKQLVRLTGLVDQTNHNSMKIRRKNSNLNLLERNRSRKIIFDSGIPSSLTIGKFQPSAPFRWHPDRFREQEEVPRCEGFRGIIQEERIPFLHEHKAGNTQDTPAL